MAAAGTAFRNVGWWLQSPDELRPARAIVVLGGGVPFRAIQAARLFQAGLAPEVWVTTGRQDRGDQLLKQLGISTSSGRERDQSEEILIALHVPRTAVRQITEPAANTVAEMRAVIRFAAADPKPVIIVTSPYHVRRVQVLARIVSREAGPGPPVIVRYAEDDPYDPAHWWRNTTDAISTFREVFGIINAQAGFPLSPSDR